MDSIKKEYEILRERSTFVLPADKSLSLEEKLEWYIKHLKKVSTSSFEIYKQRALELLPKYEDLYFKLTKKDDFKAYLESRVTVKVTLKCNVDKKNKEIINEVYEKIKEQLFNGEPILLTPDIELTIDHVMPEEVVIMSKEGKIINNKK